MLKYFLLLMLFICNSVFSFEFTEGVGPNNARWNVLTSTDFDAGYFPQFAVDAGNGVVYTYDSSLGKANYLQKKLLDAWSLTPWSNHLFLAGEYSAAAELGSSVRGEEFEFPENSLQVIDDWEASYYSSDLYVNAGCLKKIPLRYGDVNDNSNKEIVVIVGASIIFFSPEQEKIIFSYHYEMNDDLTAEATEGSFPPPYKDNAPQFFASSGTDVLVMTQLPAQKSYSKIYVGDFDADQNPDILLWRKLYRSNLRNNPETGYHLLAEGGFHYELINGEYALQETLSETALGWLTSAELTWQKGFPSKSECEGEEGQLIPEMHDPFLNDPDVLL